MCGTTLFQNPATARTAGSCERIGATKAPVLSPAFFRPPVHFQKHGNPPTEVGPIVVGKPHVILPFDEKGQCRREVSRLFATLARQGPKAVVCGQRMPPRLHPPNTRAYRAKQRLFSSLCLSTHGPPKVGPGFCPELRPAYSRTRCLPCSTLLKQVRIFSWRSQLQS